MGIDITGKIKRLEYFSELSVPSDAAFVVRLDGSNFGKFTKPYAKPFDREFNRLMVDVTTRVMENYSEISEGGTHSDEISLYFPATTGLFHRRVEKLVSEIAGFATAQLVNLSGRIGHFDGRVIVTPTPETVIEYRKDRWMDAIRGCINGTAYWLFRLGGVDKTTATKRLDSLNSKQKQELILEEFGINISDLPAWQREGNRLMRVEYTKKGYNPIKNIEVEVVRNKIELIPFDIKCLLVSNSSGTIRVK